MAGPAPTAPDNDPRDLLSLAVDVHTDLGKLATGLAHAGAAPQALQEITQMVQVVAGVVKALGQGPIGQTGPGAEPQGAPPPQQSQEQPPQQATPQGGPPASGPQAAPQHAMHAAAHALHAAMIASAQRRGQ